MAMAIHTAASMPTDRDQLPPGQHLARLRLMQLVSPALPIGGFTYSQGLEYAVEAGWVNNLGSLQDWLLGLLDDSLAGVDIPLLARIYQACACSDPEAIGRWGAVLLASRETAELRREERQRARALVRLLDDLNMVEAGRWRDALQQCQAAPFALAALNWGIPLTETALGYAWSWLENMVAAAVKLVPLGQTDGQRVELILAEAIPGAVARGLQLQDDDLGGSAPAMALASSLHETQYTRLFRS